MTLISFAVDWAVWDGEPFGFHLRNVLLHALVTALLVFFLLTFFPWWAALFGGLIFAVHSVHTEVVANVVGRAELFAALFVLAGCLIYMKGVRGHRGIRPAGLIFIAVFYALAGLSKEVGFVMPALLLATDLPLAAGVSRNDLLRMARARAPLFAALAGVAVLLLLARWAVLGTAVGHVSSSIFALDDSFATRLFTMARVWPRYVELLLFPIDLSADYSPAVILPAQGFTPLGLAGFLLVLGLLGLAAVSYRRAPELTMALAWAAIALLPVSNLLFTAETALGERRLYLPSVAVSLLAALALVRTSGFRRRVAAGVAIAWVVTFAGVTVNRNPVWESTDTVFVDLLRKHPESSRALFGLGLRHHELGNFAESREWFRRALEIWPWYANYQVKYALVLIEQSQLEEAAARARTAVQLQPASLGHRKLLVLTLLWDDRYREALAAIDEALRHVQPDASLYAQKADAHGGVGDFAAAAEAQRNAIEGGHTAWASWLKLARFEAAAGDTAAALNTLARARSAPGALPKTADSLEAAWSSN